MEINRLLIFLDPPSAPAGVRVTDRSKGRIVVAWDKSSSAAEEHLNSYVIQQRKTSENVFQTAATVDADAAGFTLDKFV